MLAFHLWNTFCAIDAFLKFSDAKYKQLPSSAFSGSLCVNTVPVWCCIAAKQKSAVKLFALKSTATMWRC